MIVTRRAPRFSKAPESPGVSAGPAALRLFYVAVVVVVVVVVVPVLAVLRHLMNLPEGSPPFEYLLDHTEHCFASSSGPSTYPPFVLKASIRDLLDSSSEQVPLFCETHTHTATGTCPIPTPAKMDPNISAHYDTSPMSAVSSFGMLPSPAELPSHTPLGPSAANTSPFYASQ